MALVVICGQPCSGKTTVATLLYEALKEAESKPTVRIVNETSLHLDRNKSYGNMSSEKDLRGAIRSEVERSLLSDDIIIVDSLNNIKGYRYKLWCLARAAGTRYCVVYCNVKEDDCRKWNEERWDRDESSYDENILEDLLRRFESPDRRNKWDSPLFELCPINGGIERSSEVVLDVVSYLTKMVDSKTTVATQSARPSGTISLYEMDEDTLDVIDAVIEGESKALLRAENRVVIGLPELRRLRRTFIRLIGKLSLSGSPPPTDAESLKRMFVDFLKRQMGN